jgi:DNA-binding GntR family transcriptional regulator
MSYANEGRLDRRSSGEQAALYIRRLIVEGELRPGSRVPQDEIAGTLGISRIPLREALIALETEGWVTNEMHRGAFVNALDQRSVEDHFEIFGLLYGFAIRRALERSGPDLVEQLAKIKQRLEEAPDDPQLAGELLFSVYTTIVDAAQSFRLRVVLRSIASLVPGDFFTAVPSAIDVERKALGRVVNALKRSDADKAVDEFQRMMRTVADEVVGLFEQRGLFATAEEQAGSP